MLIRRVFSMVVTGFFLLGSALAVAQTATTTPAPAVTPSARQPSAAARQLDRKVAVEQHKIDQRAATTLQDVLKQNPGAKKLFDEAAGYAVFTGTKAGFFVSGAGGTGVAVDKSSGQRTYMKMGSAGVGLSFGARQFDLVILFKTPQRFTSFIQGGWDSSATAGATAGTQSREVGSSFFDGVAIYRVTKRGLMASADVSGTRFWVADDLN